MKKEKLELLRQEMKKENISYYIIPTNDDHMSEYIPEYFQARKYFSGFTGSQGTLLVGLENSYIWVDGRYFIQAEKQIKPYGIILKKIGFDETIEEFIQKNMKKSDILGIDSKIISMKQAESFEKACDGNIKYIDLYSRVWENRAPFPSSSAFYLDLEYTGKDETEKIQDIREIMKQKKVNSHLISSLDDIAWILNIRGSDISRSPVNLCFLLIEETECKLFIQKSKLSNSLIKHYESKKIFVLDYDTVYTYVSKLKGTILLDDSKTNQALASTIQCKINLDINPSSFMKAVKNDTEIKATKNAHIKDGIAITKFIYLIKTKLKNEHINEFEASNILEELRREQKGLFDLSFNTIAAYGKNAAMMHYSATEKENSMLEPNGFFLVDSGGQFLEGTTDITRTICMGPLTEKMKYHYTKVLQAHIRLAMQHFLAGTSGTTLDIVSRGVIWNIDMNYNCGTGHGVGHVLNVHEGPQGFRNKGNQLEILPNTITTDEPGIYIENQYGIRIENELLCVLSEKNEYGQFLKFVPITVCPIDLDPVIPSLLSDDEKQYLNQYHEMVYQLLSPYLNKEECDWLKKETRGI